MTFANFNNNYTDSWMPEFLIVGESHTAPQQLYVALFRDTAPDEGNLLYTGSGDESEYTNELNYYTGVTGYSRQPVNFNQTGIENGVVTLASSTDLLWTNSGSTAWPAPNYVVFSYNSTPSTTDSQHNSTGYIIYTAISAPYVKTVEPGDQYRIPAGALRITY